MKGRDVKEGLIYRNVRAEEEVIPMAVVMSMGRHRVHRRQRW